MEHLTLKQAIKEGRLDEFIEQANIRNDNPTAQRDFEKLLRSASQKQKSQKEGD